MNLSVTEKFQLPQTELVIFIIFSLIPMFFTFILFKKEKRAVLVFSIILSLTMSYAGIIIGYILLKIYGSNTIYWQERIKLLMQAKGVDEDGKILYKAPQETKETPEEEDKN